MADVLSLEIVPDGKGSERMLTVEHYELIRRRVLNEGKSQRQVARELGHSRKTIAKALKLRIPPGYRLTEPRWIPSSARYGTLSMLPMSSMIKTDTGSTNSVSTLSGQTLKQPRRRSNCPFRTVPKW